MAPNVWLTACCPLAARDCPAIVDDDDELGLHQMQGNAINTYTEMVSPGVTPDPLAAIANATIRGVIGQSINSSWVP